MNEWQIQADGQLSRVTEAELGALIEAGHLRPTDLVRPPGATGFVPLQHLALASQRSGGAPLRGGGSLRGLVVHAVIFIGAVGFLARGPLLALATLWTVALVAHGVWVMLGRRAASPVAPEPQQTPQLVSPFVAEVDSAASAVQAVWDAAPQALGQAPDLAGLRAAATRLDAAHEALTDLFSAAALTDLRSERAAARGRLEATEDASSAEVFTEELSAIDDRLAGMEAAQSVSEQIAARKRTLLHHLAGLRLAAVQSTVSHDGQDPSPAAHQLVDKTAALRDALRASSEVEDALARARAAARTRQS